MSEEEALKVFAARGVVVDDMTTGDLRAAYVKLALAAHPDRGGAAGEI
jgi:hypothetical protein